MLGTPEVTTKGAPMTHDIGIKAKTEELVNVFVEIGNSDGKLDQEDWADYCSDMLDLVNEWGTTILGVYYSLPHTKFQNACFHLFVEGVNFNKFEQDITVVRAKYDQDSVAVSQGDTVFVTGPEDEKRNPL